MTDNGEKCDYCGLNPAIGTDDHHMAYCGDCLADAAFYTDAAREAAQEKRRVARAIERADDLKRWRRLALARDQLRRYLGDVAPDVAAGWDMAEIRHALELRFGASPDWEAEDLDGLAHDVAELLQELTK